MHSGCTRYTSGEPQVQLRSMGEQRAKMKHRVPGRQKAGGIDGKARMVSQIIPGGLGNTAQTTQKMGSAVTLADEQSVYRSGTSQVSMVSHAAGAGAAGVGHQSGTQGVLTSCVNRSRK